MDCNECTTLMWNVNGVGGCVCVWVGVNGDFVFSAQLRYESKSALKKKLFKKHSLVIPNIFSMFKL